MAALETGQVSVGTSATLVCTVENPVRDVLVSGGAAFYVGGSGVTASTGFPIPATTPTSIPVAASDPPFSIYAVAASSTTVSYAFLA